MTWNLEGTLRGKKKLVPNRPKTHVEMKDYVYLDKLRFRDENE